MYFIQDNVVWELGATWYSMVYGMVWYMVYGIWYGMVYDMVWYGIVW